jgi:P4 family phage/plasmid primase-like protien
MDGLDLIRRNTPAGLREPPQWVCWRSENAPDGRSRKVPCDPKTGRPASSTDPAAWSAFEQALEACAGGGYAGVGFVFTAADPFCGIDLDDCRDEAGTLAGWAAAIVGELASYAEISPSGRGVKVFVRAVKPGPRCRTACEGGEVELYDRDRFFTVTGHVLPNVRGDAEERQAQVDALYERLFGPADNDASATGPAGAPREFTAAAPCVLSDDEIIRLAGSLRRKSGAGQKFADLFEGRWEGYFGSASEADSSLCWTLVYYTKDPGQIDRLFRRSGLYRPKWDERHGRATYGQLTIEKALAGVTGQYTPPKRWAAHERTDAATDTTGDPPDELPPLYRPDVVARLFREANARLIYWRDVFHLYGRTCYQPLTEAELGARVAAFITEVGWWARPARKVGLAYEKGAIPHPDYGDLMVVLEKVVPKVAHIREIFLQLKIDYLPDATDAPIWLTYFTRPLAVELLACANGLLHLPTGRLHPHDEELFALNAVDYDYEPRAPAPSAWLAFLYDLFGDDLESVETLQELFGYFLLPDTRQEKIGLIVGPKRSGKGTIGRVLTGLLGKANVCAPTLASLGTNFGLWPLLHKPLAIISDARLSGRTDQAVVVERLLSISGEDTITVDRKHLAPWTGKLPTRFLILTNELPKLSDASGALASRFVLLCLTRSFYGREDMLLTDRLLEERPGILNWAIQGWRRLNERGYFVQPGASEEALRQLEDLASPINAFVRERCIVGPDRSVEAGELFAAWRTWCEETGRAHAGTIQGFGRDLRAAVPGLRMSQPRVEGGRTRFYEGLALAEDEQATGLAGTLGTHGTRSW